MPLRLVAVLLAVIAAWMSLAPQGSAVPIGSHRLLLLGGSIPSWMPPGFGSGSIGAYFANNQYFGITLSQITDTRSGAATCGPDASGNWYQAATLTNCIVPGVGLSAYEARTNGIRNNTMVGAVAGSPGTLPTNWVVALQSGISQTIVGTGTESGISYIDIQLTGTASASGSTTIQFDSSTNPSAAATYGQTWAGTAFVYLGAGALTNITSVTISAEPRTSGGVGGIGNNPITFTPGAGPLGLARQSSIYTPNTSTTAFMVNRLAITTTNGQQIGGSPSGVTLRIGAPQLENNSLINSSVASATVNAGGTLYTPSSSGTVTWAGSGCTANPVLNVTTSGAGAINAVSSVATAGSCTVFPPAGATTWTDGTGLGTGSGASFNLTPTNNAAEGFATPPILTTNAAVTRNLDFTTFAGVPHNGPASSIFARITPAAPSTYPQNQFIAQYDDTSNNNRLGLFRNSGAGNGSFVRTVAGSGSFNGMQALTQNSINRFAASFQQNSQIAYVNGVPDNTLSASIPASGVLTRFSVGAANNGSSCNCTIALIALNPSQFVPASQLQTASTVASLDDISMPRYADRLRKPANDNVMRRMVA